MKRLYVFFRWLFGKPVYRFEIRKSNDKDQPYYWVFVGPNNEDICVGETQHRKYGVEQSIDLLRDHGSSALIIDKTLNS